MNLTKLKTFAPAARAAFIAAVTRRAAILGIQTGRVEEVTESGDVALIGGQPFPRSVVPLRKQLLDLIHRDGFDHTMEAMAYTWFNRLVALRFMELHDGYLDHGYRVLSHPQGSPLPEILQHAEHVTLSGLDREEVIRLKLDGNRDEELYRLLLLAQCSELNRILPSCFSRLDDATILLLPDNLLHSDSVIRQLIAGSDAEDWQQVEVLGWLYQFYISEKKDAVMARKSAVPTEDIPAVTQLFTPHWIVRYLVENSLGRLWLLNRPGSRLRDHMPYYIEGEAETDFLKITKPEDIKLLDPAVGSGHMLTYAFDLLVHIYEEEGYAANDIPGLILKHNLYGTEICPRAAQLAELALVFKAREKSRRFFQSEHLVRPNITELKDIRFEDGELQAYFKALGCQPSDLHPQLATLLHQFEEAKNFGSLIQPCLTEAEIQSVRSAIQNSTSIIHNSDLMVGATHLKVLRVLEQAEALTQRYHGVVANPPYLGNRLVNSHLAIYSEAHYPTSRLDTYSMFLERGLTLLIPEGQLAMVTMQTWMFTSGFEEFRRFLLQRTRIANLIQIGARGFDTISGEIVQTSALSLRNSFQGSDDAIFIDLKSASGESAKSALLTSILKSRIGYYHRKSSSFLSIPGCPIAYWLGSGLLDAFINGEKISDYAKTKQGIATGSNDNFMRYWHEVASSRTALDSDCRAAAMKTHCKWFPYSKGGPALRWYGNHYFVVDWQNDGVAIVNFRDESGRLRSRPQNLDYQFRPAITWSLTAGSETQFAARFRPHGHMFDINGMSAFPEVESHQKTLLGLLNSTVSHLSLKAINPSLAFQSGDIGRIPVQAFPDVAELDLVVDACIEIARADWDNFETSWDFRDQPLLRPGLKGATLEASWRNWEAQSTAAICRMQELETENNRLFIAAYGLEGELQPEVPEAQITLARAEARRDMAAFLSYAVGCMMGRYSLDAEGLICANAAETVQDYLRVVNEKRQHPGVSSDPSAVISEENWSFAPDADAIIPVLDGEWFEDDIVARTKEFLRATFGEATVAENIRFIEESLGQDLRSYFLTEFYKNHLQTYKNRPIYWLFSSGKQRAFQCLVYLHRYQEGTLARIRTEYVIPLQGKLGGTISRLEEEVPKTASSAARKKLQTELDKRKKQMVELIAFDEQLRSYADQAITLDLDDGVKVNYAKFGPLVAEAKKVCGTKDD